jgi:hypothetical protein
MGYNSTIVPIKKTKKCLESGRHWIGKKGGGDTEGTPKKDFVAIPYFLVIADYEKAFLYVALK